MMSPYFLYVLSVSTIGPLLFGFHLSELNAPEDLITCAKYSNPTESLSSSYLPQCIPMNPIQWGLVSSILTLGGLLSALVSGHLAAKYGRLPTMRLITIPYVLGAVLSAISPNVVVLSIGRFVSGLGAGASIVVAPIYVAEVAPPAEKGFYGSFTQVMVNVGILMTQLLGYFLNSGQLWRFILAAAAIIPLLQAVFLIFLVESPTWLANQGKVSQGKHNLRLIRGGGVDVDQEVASWQFKNMDEEQTLISRIQPPDTDSSCEHKLLGILEVVRHPNYQQAVLAVVMIMLAQQFTGINSIIMYGVHLLSSLLTTASARVNLFVSALNIAVTIACAPLVEKLGRKTCLLISIAGMGISSFVLAVSLLGSLGFVSAIAVVLFVSSFAVGLGPIPFILSSELVDPVAVGATQSWALATNWLATFAVAQFFPIVNSALGGNTYFIFAGLAFVFGCLVAFMIPETKGRLNADEVWGRVVRRLD